MREGERDGTAGEPDRLAPVTYLPGARRAAEDSGRPRSADAPGRMAGTPAGSTAATDSTATAGSTATTGREDRARTRATNVSLHQLARRGMSRWELEQILAKRGVDAETAARELDRLEGLGLVDDAALAVTLVHTQHGRKGLGRTAIEHDLRRRHIDQVLIEDALADIGDDDERERAFELARSRAERLRSVEPEAAARRLSGYLLRKGYSGELVRSAVRDALADRPRSAVHFE